MSNVYEILEVCLQEIENGADVDSVLFRYPEYADELRPILEASVHAKSMAVPAPSSDIVRRNRAKVLQRAAEMREEKVRSSRRLWSVPLRRAFVTLVIVAVLFTSGTGLVRAASTTLPGDNLYPVKRTWEDMLILFTFNLQARETLEMQHENERLEELYEVFAEGRSVEVDFAGMVTRQNGTLWLVSGIPVATSAQTDLPVQPIAVGDAVHVVGVTQKDGAVLAQMIDLLPAGVPLPEYQHDESSEHEGSEDPNQADDDSVQSPTQEAPKAEPTQTTNSSSSSDSSEASSESEPNDKSFKGVVDSISGNILVVNGQIINIGSATIEGTPRAGAFAKVEGYYDANGLFIVIKIEFQSNDSGSGSVSTNGGDDGSNDSGDDNSGSDDQSQDNNDSHDGGGDSGSSDGGSDH